METAKWWRRDAGPGYMLYTHRSADLVKNTTFFGYHDALSGALISTRYIRFGKVKLLVWDYCDDSVREKDLRLAAPVH